MGKHVNKTEMALEIQRRHGRQVSPVDAVGTMVEIIAESLERGESVTLTGFATLEPYLSARTKAFNPKTGESVDVPPRKRVRCRVSRSFITRLNGKAQPSQ